MTFHDVPHWHALNESGCCHPACSHTALPQEEDEIIMEPSSCKIGWQASREKFAEKLPLPAAVPSQAAAAASLTTFKCLQAFFSA